MLQSKRLNLPLLPRRDEQALIRQAFQEAREGGVRLVFLGGQSGTGKSSLVDSALQFSADNPTWHVKTKFDQRRTNAPLTNLRYMISDLVDLIGQEKMCSCIKQQLDQTQQEVLKSFLMDGNLSDTEAEDSDPEEETKWDDNSNEFRVSNKIETQKDAMSLLVSTLRATLRIISNLNTVVITMDDMHWGCKITEHVLKAIFTDASLKSILVCATFRTKEDTATQGFYEWKTALEQEMDATPNTKYYNILLDNLTQTRVQEWLAEALSREISDVEDLAQTVYGFTHGNLFFTKHFLERLQDDELLTFDFHQFKWQWDTDIIKRRSSLSDNVVESLTLRLRKQPDCVQNVLMLAACFGNQFDVRALEATKSALNVGCVKDGIEKALEENFIVQLNKTHYRFAHDTIQLAAYGLCPDEMEFASVHWKIGTLLYEEGDLMNKDEVTFFATVDHLNLGADCNLDTCGAKKQCLLAKLNYVAGCKASKLSSFMPAAVYFEAGIKALGDEPFERCYKLAIKLYTMAASTELVVGHIEESRYAAQQVWEHGNTCTDKLKVMDVTFDCYVAQNDQQGLMDMCFSTLEKAGLKLPRKPNTVYAQLEYQKMKGRVKSMSDEDILGLPVMENAQQEVNLQILNRMIFPAYHREEANLAMVIACLMVNITLKYGWSDRTSGRAFASAGSYLAAQSHDIQEAYRLGILAEKLVRRHGVTADNVVALTTAAQMTKWWLEPVQNGLEVFQECYRISMKGGQVANAFLGNMGYSMNYFYSGLPLEPLLDDVDKYCNQYLEYNQMTSFCLGTPLWQCLLCLTGREKDPANMNEGRVAAMRREIDNPERNGEQSMKSYQMTLSFYLGDLPTATKMAEELNLVNPGAMKASFWYTSRRFMLALVAIANFRCATHCNVSKASFKAIADKHLKYFRKVVKAGAINLVHKLQLLEAEMLNTESFFRGRKNLDAIFDKYDQAVVSATRSGFLQDAALANYLCFQYCKDAPDRSHLAELYLKRSFELWVSWGAIAVASSLIERHPDQFDADSVRDSLNDMNKDSRRSSSGSLRGRSRFDANLALQHRELNVK